MSWSENKEHPSAWRAFLYETCSTCPLPARKLHDHNYVLTLTVTLTGNISRSFRKLRYTPSTKVLCSN